MLHMQVIEHVKMALFMILVMAVKFTSTVSRHAPFSPDCQNASSGAVTIERQFVNTAFRLTGGCNNHSGELQIKYLNQDWRSVCYDEFDYFDAQFACSFLGFQFVASIYEISAPSNSLGVEYSCTGQNLADGATRIPQCSSYTFPITCKSYAGVVCDTTHSPSDGYVAIAVYSYGTQFDIIAPEDGVFFDNCYVRQYGYCHGVYFGNKNNTLVDTLVSILSQSPIFPGEIKHCGSHYSIANFGITCSPIPGDPILRALIDGQEVIAREGLVWYYDELHGWVSVCGDAMGYMEAQVLCNSLQFPYFTFLQLSHHSPNQTNSSKVISSIECSGHETKLADCHIELVNTSDVECSSLSMVGCDGSLMGSINDRAIIVFDTPPEGHSVAPLTVIVPIRKLYLTNCSTVLSESDSYCSGAHIVEGNNTGLRSVYLDPSNCQGVQYQLFGLQCASTTDLPAGTAPVTTIAITDQVADHSNTYASVLVVSLSVCGVLIAVIGLAACVGLCIGYKRMRMKKMDKARMEIIKDLEDRHISSMSFSGNFQVRKCHRPVIRRRSSATHHRIDNQSWEIPFECITLSEELGSGAYGTIQKGVIDCCHQDEPVDVAVKLLKKYASESERHSLMQEIDMMKDIGYHRHVVCMLACCTQGMTIALVMEFMPCGDLQTFLKKHRNAEVQKAMTVGSLAIPNPYIMGVNSYSIGDGEELLVGERKEAAKHTLSLTEQLQFARQITLGMEYLSGMKIVHRDLATRNVLIDEEMFLKISDFGLSRDIYSDSSYHMAHNKDRLPVRWMAIESIIDRDFSVASDVWSFGVVLWEIMTCGSFPYYHMTNSEVIEEVKDGYRLSKPDSCPEQMYEIMSTCWQESPSLRPSFADLRGMLDSLLDKGEYTSLM